MKRIQWLVVALFACLSSTSHAWMNVYNTEERSGANISKTISLSDGNFVSLSTFVTSVPCSEYSASTHYETYLLKTKPDGSTLWSKSYSHPSSSESPFSVTPTRDGGFIVAGGYRHESIDKSCNLRTGDGFSFVSKFNVDGNLIWDRSFNVTPVDEELFFSEGGHHQDEQIVDVIESEDSSIYVIGSSSREDGDAQHFAMKLKSSGLPLWTRQFEGGYSDELWQIRETSLNHFVILAEVGSGTRRDVSLISLNSLGDLLWERTLRNPSSDIPLSLLSFGGDLFVVSRNRNVGGLEKINISRLTNMGDLIWSRYYSVSSSSNESAADAVIREGQIVVVGATGFEVFGPYADVLLFSVNLSGSPLWAKKYFSSSATAYSLQSTPSGFLVGGTSRNYARFMFSTNVSGELGFPCEKSEDLSVINNSPVSEIGVYNVQVIANPEVSEPLPEMTDLPASFLSLDCDTLCYSEMDLLSTK